MSLTFSLHPRECKVEKRLGFMSFPVAIISFCLFDLTLHFLLNKLVICRAASAPLCYLTQIARSIVEHAIGEPLTAPPAEGKSSSGPSVPSSKKKPNKRKPTQHGIS